MNLKAIHIFTIFFIITLLDISFATYFKPLFLVGFVFMIFLNSLKKSHYYLLFLSIMLFFTIEIIIGIDMFTFSFISLFLYYLVIPRIKHLFSSLLFRDFTYLFIFYIIFFIDYLLSTHSDIGSYPIFMVNFLIDSLVVGLLF